MLNRIGHLMNSHVLLMLVKRNIKKGYVEELLKSMKKRSENTEVLHILYRLCYELKNLKEIIKPISKFVTRMV